MGCIGGRGAGACGYATIIPSRADPHGGAADRAATRHEIGATGYPPGSETRGQPGRADTRAGYASG